MPTASAIRKTIEAALAERIPSALSPAPRVLRPVSPTGIPALDEVLEGGLPLGAITELVGPECSGRTSLALSFLAQLTVAGKVCGWVDVADCLQPESAAATGVDLSRLLWVRCGVKFPAEKEPSAANPFHLPSECLVPPPVMKGLHGSGFGPHPRTEAKGLSDAIPSLLFSETKETHGSEPQPRARQRDPHNPDHPFQPSRQNRKGVGGAPWSRIEQALRATDLLLQAGGFSAIVLDMGSIPPEHASRVPLATWFRYRAAAERTQASFLLLTQYACAKSSAGLVLQCNPAKPPSENRSVFTGMEYRVSVNRERRNVVPMRKPPQSERDAQWQGRTSWAGRR